MVFNHEHFQSQQPLNQQNKFRTMCFIDLQRQSFRYWTTAELGVYPISTLVVIMHYSCRLVGPIYHNQCVQRYPRRIYLIELLTWSDHCLVRFVFCEYLLDMNINV